MSARPSDKYRTTCDVADDCDLACNYIVLGAEIAGLSFARRLSRNGINKPITIITQGANRTQAPRITNLSYPVINARNAKENLLPITVQYSNVGEDDDDNDSSYVEDFGFRFDLAKNKTDTYFAPTGVIGATLGSYMINRIGRWDYELSGRAAARVANFLRNFATTVDFNAPNREWARRLSATLNIPLVSHAVGPGPGILDHIEIFMKPVGGLGGAGDFIEDGIGFRSTSTGNSYIREIGLDLYRNTIDRGVDIQPNLRNFLVERTNTPGLFNITANGITYPRSKIAFKMNPLLKLQIASIGNLDIVADDIRTEYRFVAPIPINGTVFPGNTYSRRCWLTSGMKTDDYNCGCSSKSSNCGSSESGIYNPVRDWCGINRCRCDPISPTGGTGYTTGIDFSNVEPYPDLIYGYLGFSMGNPNGCNTSFTTNGSAAKLHWNVQTYLTSEDLYETSQEGRFSQPGSLLLVVDAQHLTSRRRISFDNEGNQVNIRYNRQIVEARAAFEFATIVSNILYTLTAVRYDPKALLRVNNVCTPDGECTANPSISITPNRQSTMSFWTNTIGLLYNSGSMTA